MRYNNLDGLFSNSEVVLYTSGDGILLVCVVLNLMYVNGSHIVGAVFVLDSQWEQQ